MSVVEFRSRIDHVADHFGKHLAFTGLIPTVDQMYQCVRIVPQRHFPLDMGKLLMLSHREFLVGCNLLQCGLPLDAGANTRRAIEIARLALAVKRDRANAEKWMQGEKRQERWDARQDGERPKNLPPLQWPEIDNDPLFAPLKDYFGMYSDTFVHFTPEFIGQQHFDERPSQDGVAIINLRYFSSDRMVIQNAITICGIHGKILGVFDACFDNMVSNDGGWKMLKATFDQLGADLWKQLPPDDAADAEGR